jgi:hypothetical protein
MWFSLLLMLLCIMYVQPNSIFFFLSDFSIDLCWVILHYSSFVILSVHFIFIICLSISLQISAVFLLFGW